MKKSSITQELVNPYPPNSAVRNDEQSLGYQILNVFAQRLEKKDKQLAKMKANVYLTTANLDEIDILYKVKLPATFEFDTDNTDPAFPVKLAPTVSGVLNEISYPIRETADNDLDSFWYEAVPDRYSIDYAVSGVNHELFSCTVSGLSVSGVWEHHLPWGGNIWVETTGGAEYLGTVEGKLAAGQIVLTGKTRKGTEESEAIVFSWDSKQKTFKEWKEIYDIDAYDIESGVFFELRSGDFNQAPYIDFYNLRFSPNRRKIDQFWGIGTVEGVSTLDQIEYMTDEWEQLVMGFSDTYTAQSWELLDCSGTNINALDMTVQPFSDRAWILSTDNSLYCYDLSEIMVSGFNLLKPKTVNSDIRIEVEYPKIVKGEDIEFFPIHFRPLKEILKYRLWYQTPSGDKYGLLNGSPVSYSSDFWVWHQQKTQRTIEDKITITTAERGEYLLVFEVVYIDNTEHQDRRIVSTNNKEALCGFDLTTALPGDAQGIDFDSDQRLWVETTSGYYRINLHYDIMLIDYDNKTIYARENYDQIGVDDD